MDSVGERLREARIQAGLSLSEVSARTKIRTPLLDAIERAKFERLPQGLVARGFFRAYARQVGLDPESIVRQFREEFEHAVADREVSPVPTVVAGAGQTPIDVAPAWQRQLLTAAAMFVLAVALVMLLNRSSATDAPALLEPVGTAGVAIEPGVDSGPDQDR